MSSLPLNVYVPIRVQAWIKNAQTTQYPEAIQPFPNYSQIGNYQNDVMPDPTNWQSARYDANGYGAYIHWTIPRGFRSGIRNEYTPDQTTDDSLVSSDEVYYPFAPNRWLITRVVTSSSPQTSRSWFVASDIIVPSADVNNTTMGNAVFPSPNSNGVTNSNIGCCLAFTSNWSGENGLIFSSSSAPAFVNLQLAGSGNPLFADYQPHCLNVFSIFDPLATDTSVPSSATLSYSVIGWYSSDSNDPLGSGANPTLPPEIPINSTTYTTKISNTSSDPLYMLTNLRLGLTVNTISDVGTGAPDLFTNVELNPNASSVPPLIGTTESPTLAIPGPGSNTIFHGSLYGVGWSSSSDPLSVPQTFNQLGTDQIQCAIGTNGLEAMSALINNSPPDLINGNNQLYKDMFNSFIYGFANEITDPNAAVKAFDDIYENSFQPSPGGTLWRIVHRGDEAAPDPTGPQQFTTSSSSLDTPVRLTAQQAAAVDALNVAQNTLDVATRRMNLRIWEFFATWWQTRVTNPNSATIASALQGALTVSSSISPIWGNMSPTAYIASLTDPTQGLIAELQATVNTQISLVNQILTGNVELELQNFSDTSFWTPNDPSIVLSGLSGAQTAWPSDYLTIVQCRRDSQFLSQGFTCTGSTANTVSLAATTIQTATNKITFPYNVSVLNTDYPAITSVGIQGGTKSFVAVLQMIFSEFVLLDPANTSTLASSLNLKSGSLKNIITPSTSVYAIDPTAAGASTALPSAYAMAQWTSQPWAPLFAVWKIRWFQTDPALWSFNEQNTTTNRPYYSFNGSTAALSASQIAQLEQQSSIITGRIILTPGTNNLVKSRLLQFTNEDPDFITYSTTNTVNIQQILSGINNWDMFSQTLSGFNDILLTRATGLHLIPNGTSQVAGSYYKFMAGVATNEDVENISQVELSGFTPSPDVVGQWAMVPSLGNSTTNPFQPVIQGQFRFHDLQIVDRFGQSVSLASDAAWSNFQAAKSDIMSLTNNPGSATVSPIAPQCAIQLPPRILQPARINANWVTNDGTNTPLKFASQGNPICGWILINYLDRALQIYDADGLSIGELRVIQESNPPTIDWYIFNLDLANDINPYLEAFIKQMQLVIVNGSNVSTALEGMFELLDLAFGSIQTPPPHLSSYAMAMIGRPLVIARASWGLELAEPPYQSWNQGNFPAQYPLSYYSSLNSFQLRIGSTNLAQDGLIGYFIDSDILIDSAGGLELGTFYSDYYDRKDTNKPNESGSGIYANIMGNFVPLVPYFYDENDSNVPYYGSNTTNPNTTNPKYIPTYQDQTVYTTLLLDPFTTIHGYTQSLPVARLDLPSWMVRQALDNLEAVFRMGPLLVTQPLDSSSTLQISEPGTGDWTWLSQGSDLLLPADVYTLQNPNIRPTDEPAPYTAIEGFLKLNFGDPSGSITAVDQLIDTADTTPISVTLNVSATFNSSSPIQITSQISNGVSYTLTAIETSTPGLTSPAIETSNFGVSSSPIPICTNSPIVNGVTSNTYTPTGTALSVAITITVYPVSYNPAIPLSVYTRTSRSTLGPVVTSFTAAPPSTSGVVVLNIQGTDIASANISAVTTSSSGSQTTMTIPNNVAATSGLINWTIPPNMVSAVITATVYDSTGTTANHASVTTTVNSYPAASISSLTTDSNFVIGLPTAITAQVVGAYYDLSVTTYDMNQNPSLFEIQVGNPIIGSQIYDIWTPPETAVSCMVTLSVYDETYTSASPNPPFTTTLGNQPVYTLPGQVVNLNVESTGSGIVLTWNPPTTGSLPTSYDVSYQVSDSGDWVDFGTITGTTATISGLLSITSYDFSVTGINTYGEGLSTIVTIITRNSNVAPGSPGAPMGISVNSYSGASVYTIWNQPLPQIVPITVQGTTIRMYSGSTNVTDASGQLWVPDSDFSSGTQTGTVSSNISNTRTPALYQSERDAASFSYTIPVSNGNYTVTLKFAEIYWTGTNQRVFSVSINGQAVITNLDLVATAGYCVAYDQSFPVTVTGSQILIEFTASVNNAKISAIQIISS